jgi:hypothetical protein
MDLPAARTPGAAPAPATGPVRPLAAMYVSDPALADVQVGGMPAREVLQRQLHFALDGSGPPSQRAIVPQTEAAARFLAGQFGPRVERLLRGTLAQLDGRAGVDLRGIALSTSAAGFQLNSAMGFSEKPDRAHALADPDPVVRRSAVEGSLETFAGWATNNHANYSAGWVNLDADHTGQLLHALTSTDAASAPDTARAQYVLAHELEHAVTPMDLSRGAPDMPHQWIEEATAEVLTLQRGAAAERARAVGFPSGADTVVAQRRDWLQGYASYHDALVDLLSLGGIDPETGPGYERAVDVLQSTPGPRGVPGRLARAIVDHRALDASRYEPLRRRIRDSAGDPAAIGRIQAWVREAEASAGASA